MKSYGQACPIALGLDKLGDRWTLLIVRELLIRPDLRFSDLEYGLPGIATNLLSSRLADLQAAGLVEKGYVGHQESITVYNLTEPGKTLDPIVTAIAEWGMQFVLTAGPNLEIRDHWLDFGRARKLKLPKELLAPRKSTKSIKAKK
jgi:DNA-binding HxlR family transcriptional regulator